MVDENTLIGIIEKQAAQNTLIIEKLNNINASLKEVHTDFKEAIDKYGSFYTELKVIQTHLNWGIAIALTIGFAIVIPLIKMAFFP